MTWVMELKMFGYNIMQLKYLKRYQSVFLGGLNIIINTCVLNIRSAEKFSQLHQTLRKFKRPPPNVDLLVSRIHVIYLIYSIFYVIMITILVVYFLYDDMNEIFDMNEYI